MTDQGPAVDAPDHDDEIADLERRLVAAKARHYAAKPGSLPPSAGQISSPSNHFLLLLSDSALPLGSFAFSSGLESHLAHLRVRGITSALFDDFLPISISSYASTTLPFVLAAYRDPKTETLVELDDALDAALICTVARRASIAQGRALLGIWERSFAWSLPEKDGVALRAYAKILRTPARKDTDGWDALPSASAHLGPLFGIIANLVGLSLEQTAYVFMLSHVKALVSAAVRASMFGPYQAQSVLASPHVQVMITEAVEREWTTPVAEAGQTVPVMDLWVGRHECLYSRIFNS